MQRFGTTQALQLNVKDIIFLFAHPCNFRYMCVQRNDTSNEDMLAKLARNQSSSYCVMDKPYNFFMFNI